MKNELHILILEDVPEEAVLVERALRREKIAFVGRRVDSRETFEDALRTFQPDIVLSDHALPQFNSIEALELCRKFNPDIPFILVTGTVSEEFAVTCLKRGADDYILKSNLTRLGSAIRNALNHRETEERKKFAEAEIISQNAQLKTANEALKKMNSEMDNFVYSVSHNLRGPISSIQGVVNIARIEFPRAELVTGKYFDMIEHNVGTLNRTITEIVHYSQNARVKLTPERVNLRELFLETYEKLNYLQQSAAITLDIETEDDYIISDRFRLGVIFQNLLSNSIRYCDPMKERMEIRLAQRRQDDAIVFNVIDNGIGIRESVMPYIYNMFYRGTERSDGAGLGLYIVRETLEKLRGAIDVESQEGEGTHVTIALPELVYPVPDPELGPELG